jgi:excisionase family DNA binding protein
MMQEIKECLCDNPTCAKCLGINCQDDNCKIHTFEAKLKFRNKIMENNKEFYLVEELAKKLRVSEMTIYRYIKAKKVKAYKIGKEYRIDSKEFNSFLDKVKTKK